jgi:DNA-binding NarL/FixJ family response regulator
MNTAIRYHDLPTVQREVVRLYVMGKTKKEIAQYRNRSLSTITNQLAVIFLKLEIHKDTELVLWYFRTLLNSVPIELIALLTLILFI